MKHRVLIGLLFLLFLVVMPLMLFAQNVGPGYYEEDHPDVEYATSINATPAIGPTFFSCARCSNEQGARLPNSLRVNIPIVGKFLVLYFQHVNTSAAMGVEVCIDPPTGGCTIIDLSKSVAADRVPYSWYFTQGEHTIRIVSTGTAFAELDSFLVLGELSTHTPTATNTGAPTATATDTPTDGPSPTPTAETTQQVIVVAIPDIVLDPAQYYSNVDGQIASFQYRITAGDFIIAVLLVALLAVLVLTPFVRRISKR